MADRTGNHLEQLASYLSGLPAGTSPDQTLTEELLASCWDQLEGGEQQGMAGHKLRGRTEQLEWDPPVLRFRIERHGATVLGSTRAELHDWQINVGNGTASCAPAGQRQLRRRQAPLDVNPIAVEVVELIRAGEEDEHLSWAARDRVRVEIGKILPAGSAGKETLAGRRKRLRNALDERLRTEGWVPLRHWVYQRQDSSRD